MMKKSILIATLGLLSFNVSAQDTPKAEEGFIFTTVKENPITSVKTKTVPAHAGVFRLLVSLKANCCVWAKANMIYQKCLWCTTP